MLTTSKNTTWQLWKISYPMMISFFSMMLMIFVDRLFLAKFSTEALNASVKAGTLSWGILLGWVTMASMSEVYVSQFNGGKQFSRIGSAVWQMIWVTLASYLFYIPFAIWGVGYIYDPLVQPQEYTFLQVLMFFGPAFSLVPAIGGFFIGQGKTLIMQWMAILGNAINIILDPIFIFGVGDIIPSMGILGAGIATGLGTLIQAVILFFLFLRQKNREAFGTDEFHVDRELLFNSIRVGLPPSIFVSLELFGWALFYHFMDRVGAIHIYVSSVCQSILMLFLFFGMGIEKGAIALSGNAIGAGNKDSIKKILYAGIFLITAFSFFATLFLVIFPEPMIAWFINNPETLEHNLLFTLEEFASIEPLIKIGLVYILFYIVFENIRWVLNGILTAAGDTMFLLISGVAGVWLFLLAPTYFFIVRPKASIEYAFIIWVAYAFISMLIIFARFLQGKWKDKTLIKERDEETSCDAP